MCEADLTIRHMRVRLQGSFVCFARRMVDGVREARFVLMAGLSSVLEPSRKQPEVRVERCKSFLKAYQKRFTKSIKLDQRLHCIQ